MYKIYNLTTLETLWTIGDAVVAARDSQEALSLLEIHLTEHPHNPLGGEDINIKKTMCHPTLKCGV